MKKLLLISTLLFRLLSINFLSAQNVSINMTGAAPDASAMFDVASTTSGFLIPCLTNTQRAVIPAPVQGLLIYNTTTNFFNVYNTAPSAGWFELSFTSYIGNTTGSLALGTGVAFNANGGVPAASAICDINSTIKGLLIPRTTTASITSPAAGLCIYNTVANGLSYFNGSSWITPCSQFVNNTTGGGSLAGTTGAAFNTGSFPPDDCAMLDISSTTKGLLVPRMTDANRNSLNPATGLTIYNTTTNLLNYWNGTGWYSFVASAPATPGPITGTTNQCSGTSGQTYSITSVTDATTYTWTVPTGWTITGGAGTNSITITAGSTGQNGNITVTAGNSCGTSAASTLAVSVNSNTVSVSIAAVPSGAICSGTSITFTATPTNGGGSPSYQWKKNGVNVGSNSTTYTNAALVNGDQITCVLTSNAACPTGNPATSNTITMTVNSTPTSPVTQYASSIIAFSTQWPPPYWQATEALGTPNTCGCGDIQTAWASATPDGQREFMVLGFTTPQSVSKIVINESYNPGAVDTVYLRNSITQVWNTVWSGTASPALPCPRAWVINIATTGYTVDAVRLAINSPAVPSWNEIDAIGIQ